MKIEIKDGNVKSNSGTVKAGPRAGQTYTIRTQEAWMHNGRDYPERIVLSLRDDNAGYGPGLYELGAESYTVGDFHAPQLARNLVLTRVADGKLAAAR